jgi:integrase
LASVYVGPDGLRHTAPVTFTVKTDAESWLGSERRLIERDALGEAEWIPPKERDQLAKAVGVRLAEYGDKEIARRDLGPRTRIQYETLFGEHIKPVLGHLSLNRISVEAVKGWHAKTLVGKPAYRAQAYNLLKSIMSSAVHDGLLQSNPCNIAKAGRIKTDLHVNILTVDELGAVADKIKPDRFRALILLSAWCGLRFGEVTELRRKDIADDCSVLTVARGVTHRKGCHVGPPKSGKRRVVVIPPHIREDIRNHLEHHVTNDAEALLFPAPRNGCHLDDKLFRTSFIAAVKTVGREDVRIHDLRHFAGSMAARVGSPIEVRNYLGHANVEMSLRYSHLASGRDAEMANQMSALTGWQADTAESTTSA